MPHDGTPPTVAVLMQRQWPELTRRNTAAPEGHRHGRRVARHVLSEERQALRGVK